MSAAAERAAGWAGALTLLVVCCGCPFPPPESGGDDASESDVQFLDADGNSTFDSATALPLATVDVLEFEGRTDSPDDLDLFELGPLSPGDRLFVDVQPSRVDLDLVAAVFDSREYLHAYNDDREPDSSNLNPLLDFVVRGAADSFFLGIAPYVDSRVTGTYEVTVRITREVGVPPPSEQIVFLDWDGGENIAVENVGIYDLVPFDAADLGPYAGRTDEMKDLVQAVVADRYAQFNLLVLNSDDHPVPAEPHTTVYFGGRHSQAFAISQQIDTLNEDAADNTIIFTQSYGSAFLRSPTFEQMAVGLGNTVAHEVGHLLGLVHTQDCASLMDSSCSDQSILAEQRFKAARLASSTFPIGLQPAAEILEWILGFVGLSP